jgi:plasmid stabilization system protein ParE
VGKRMEYKLIWSEAALADLHDICTYIAEHDSQAAYRMGRGILDHVRILAKFPLIGPPYPRRARGPLREIVFRSYRKFYDVSERTNSVEILHVWHGARDEPTF